MSTETAAPSQTAKPESHVCKERKRGAPNSYLLGLSPGVLLRIALALTAAVYARTITFDFVFDDRNQITFNEFIQSLRFLPRYFVSQVHVIDLAHVQWPGNYYRPLFNVWLAGGYAIFGAIPGWWHLVTVAAHVFVTWLVYLLAVRLAGNRTTAVLAALLFGVYPLHIEAVAWVSGVSEVQVAGCFLLSFLAYLAWREPGRPRGVWMAASLVCFVLALLSKETAVVLPAVVFAYQWIHGDAAGWRRRLRQSLAHAAPFLLMLVPYFAARYHALGRLANPTNPRPLAWVLLTAPSVGWFYLRQLLWPFRISELYDLGLQQHFSLAGVAVPALAVLALLGGSWFAGSRRVKFLIAWLVLPTLPVVAGVAFFEPYDYVHDRYLYLPSVGFVILLALGLERLGKPGGKAGKWAPAAVAAALVAVLAITTVVQCAQFDSDIALFSHAAEVAPHSMLPRDYLARSYLQINENEAGLRIYRELMRDHPDYWLGNLLLGTTLYEMGKYSEAESYLRRAAQTWKSEGGLPRPDSRPFYFLGMTLAKTGRWQEAEEPLRQAVAVRPDASGYHYALGQVLEHLGRMQEARQEYAAENAHREALLKVERDYGLIK